MQIDRVSYASSPERVLEEPFDCVWVLLEARKKPTPVSSAVLQWLDWKLQGVLSRYILEGRVKKGPVTFIPSRQRLNSPIVAVEAADEVDWGSFSANCKGMRLKRVLVLCEEGTGVAALEKQLRRQSETGLEHVVLGSSDPVGRG